MTGQIPVWIFGQAMHIPCACEAAKVEQFTPKGFHRMVVGTLYNARNESMLLADYLGHPRRPHSANTARYPCS